MNLYNIPFHVLTLILPSSICTFLTIHSLLVTILCSNFRNMSKMFLIFDSMFLSWSYYQTSKMIPQRTTKIKNKSYMVIKWWPRFGVANVWWFAATDLVGGCKQIKFRGNYLNQSKKVWVWANLIYDLVNYIIGFSFNLVDKPLLDIGLKEMIYNFPIPKIEQIYSLYRLIGSNCLKM